jgi:hypothetical protein
MATGKSETFETMKDEALIRKILKEVTGETMKGKKAQPALRLMVDRIAINSPASILRAESSSAFPRQTRECNRSQYSVSAASFKAIPTLWTKSSLDSARLASR